MALSRDGNPGAAIVEFNKIVDDFKYDYPPSKALMIALEARIINYIRLKQFNQAESDKAWVAQLVEEFPHLRQYTSYYSEE